MSYVNLGPCISFHFAYKVWSSVFLTILVSITLFANCSCESYHPSNSQPSIVGIGNVPYSCLYITFLLVGSTCPLYTSNVIVNSLSVHFAVNTIFSVISTIESAVISFDTELNHPTNVYPALVGIGNSPYFSAYTTSFVLFSRLSPSLTLNVIVYVFAAHFAYNSPSSVGLYV